VNNGGELVGVSKADADRISSQLVNLARDAVSPPLVVDCATHEYRGAQLLFVFVEESLQKPVSLRGEHIEESFVRVGGTTRKASHGEIRSLLQQSSVDRWEGARASGHMSDDDMLDSLMVDPIFGMLETKKPAGRDELLEWMAAERFISREPTGGGHILNLGAILVSARMAQFEEVSRKAIRVIVYDGTSKVRTKAETEGKIGYAIGFQGLIGHVLSELPRSEVIKQALRRNQSLYPPIALREIIANALIHQDFSVKGAGPMIEIYDNRIEISNPGRLLPSKSVDRIIGSQPESRNERLAKSMRRYRVCEERGSGLIKAGNEIELFGLPPIEFLPGDNWFKVVLHAPRSFKDMSSAERLNACYQHAVLKWYDGGCMTNTSLRQRLKMSEKQRSVVSLLIQQALDLKKIKVADPTNKSKKFAEYTPIWA
jgi:predicted HTH transcriptional regulator